MEKERDINKIQKRAVEIREKYAESDPKEWEIEQVFMGMVKDVGDLSKLLMTSEGYRDEYTAEKKKELQHEVIDVFLGYFSVGP